MNKQQLIDNHRYINVDDNNWWCEHIIEDFIERMKTKGIGLDEDQIWWSGFGCQGDGASFLTQDIHFPTFAKVHGLYKMYDWIIAAEVAGAEPFIRMTRNSSRYSHEYTVSAEMGFMQEVQDTLPWGVDEDDVRYAAAVAIQRQIDIHCDSEFDTYVTDILRDYMKELYRELDTLYFELIDDDAVWECLEINYPEIIAEELDDEEERSEEVG